MWQSCADLPCASCNGTATIIDGYVYFTGTFAANLYLVHCYDPSQDNWITLPELSVCRFGLGKINENLVAVGGLSRNASCCNKLYVYNKKSLIAKWSQKYPPMPTARRSPGILCLPSALLVVGGVKDGAQFANEVEILKLDVMQWSKATQIPVPCACMSLVSIGNTCYATGGYYGFQENTTFLKEALHASMDDLLHSSTAAKEPICGSRLIWKSLPDTPRYIPTAGVLAGRLLAIGGGDQPRGGADMKEVYLYSDTAKCWVYIGDLPAPRGNATVVALSATEILVIGGYNSEEMSTVYKGTLQIEP